MRFNPVSCVLLIAVCVCMCVCRWWWRCGAGGLPALGVVAVCGLLLLAVGAAGGAAGQAVAAVLKNSFGFC